MGGLAKPPPPPKPPLFQYIPRGLRGQQNCVPKIDLRFGAPLISFICFLRKNVLMWVGGGGGSGGGAQAAIPPPWER